MQIRKIDITIISVNSYAIFDEETKEGAIIDPGDQLEKLINCIEDNEIDLKYILLTHSHADHIGSAEALRAETGAKIFIHKDEDLMLQSPEHNLSPILLGRPEKIIADELLYDGQIIKLSKNINIEVIHTPGHSPGGVVFKIDNVAFVGDSIFKGSIGRTDLYKGDQDQLLTSIREKILCLDEDTILYPGHGPETSVGQEKISNPFLKQ